MIKVNARLNTSVIVAMRFLLRCEKKNREMRREAFGERNHDAFAGCYVTKTNYSVKHLPNEITMRLLAAM